MVLVSIDRTSPDTPTDHSPPANLDLHGRINKLLMEVDKLSADLVATDGVPPPPTRTVIKGVSWLKQGAFLLEFDTADSAAR
ncbi:hypothetical protein C0993_010150, partial [Termitomyces sp. T159_Od127]